MPPTIIVLPVALLAPNKKLPASEGTDAAVPPIAKLPANVLLSSYMFTPA